MPLIQTLLIFVHVNLSEKTPNINFRKRNKIVFHLPIIKHLIEEEFS